MDGHHNVCFADYPLTKSKSHESELGNRLHPVHIPLQATTPANENAAKTTQGDDGTGAISLSLYQSGECC